MKLQFSIILLLAIAVYSCGGSQSQSQSETSTTEAAPEEAAPKEVEAVSIWDKISIRETPSDKGEYVTSLSLGEKLTYLGVEETSADDKVFLNVRLNDGTEGWVRSEFVAPEAEPAAFIEETNIYKRPDLLTKTDDKFFKMDIVAVIQVQDTWAEVKGRPTGEKWFKSGWVKADNISYNQIEIAMAKFAQPILSEPFDEETPAKIAEILSNQDLSSSVFTDLLKSALDSVKNSDPLQKVDSVLVQ
ncbi:MAG: SH3 domain-containing protein [Cyclobacteriaceae bacterium]